MRPSFAAQPRRDAANPVPAGWPAGGRRPNGLHILGLGGSSGALVPQRRPTMATRWLLASLLCAALGVTAAAFALHARFARPLPPEAADRRTQQSAAPAHSGPERRGLDLAMRARTRFVVLEAGARPLEPAKARAVKPPSKKAPPTRSRPPQPEAAAWPWNLFAN